MPAARGRLFAYGTLMFAPIFATVCGRVLDARPASLCDHARYRVRGARYPGLVPQAGCRTQGVLYNGLNATDWRRLDAFEGAHYARTLVEVTDNDGVSAIAWAYITVPEARPLLEARVWSPGTFARRHLAHYLDACRAGTG